MEIKTKNADIFADFVKERLYYGNKKANQALFNKIQSWAGANKNPGFDVLVATLLCKDCKDKGTDIENLLFYNLNSHASMNKLISNSSRIIFQCVDKLENNWKNNWPKNYTNYLYYYFYGLFDQQSYKSYLLYTCNRNYWIKIDLSNIKEKLMKAKGVNEKRKLVDNYRENNIPKVRVNTKYCLKIKIPDNLIYDIKSLKEYVDRIVVYLNAKNIIEHPEPEQIVNDKGYYNPSDDLLYYCEIEKNNPEPNKIEVCVCPILDEICYYNGNLKNYPVFDGKKYEISESGE